MEMHPLKPYNAPADSFSCMSCQRKIEQGQRFFGCKACNYMSCETCAKERADRLHFEAKEKEQKSAAMAAEEEEEAESKAANFSSLRTSKPKALTKKSSSRLSIFGFGNGTQKGTVKSPPPQQYLSHEQRLPSGVHRQYTGDLLRTGSTVSDDGNQLAGSESMARLRRQQQQQQQEQLPQKNGYMNALFYCCRWEGVVDLLHRILYGSLWHRLSVRFLAIRQSAGEQSSSGGQKWRGRVKHLEHEVTAIVDKRVTAAEEKLLASLGS